MDKLWNYFTDIGLKDRLETSEKKKVVLLNVISVSWSLLIVLLVAKEVISYVVGKASFQQLVSATTSDILQLVVFVVILELQYNHKYKYARWIFIWGITVRAIVFLNFIRPGELTEYGLIQIPLLALLLFAFIIIVIIITRSYAPMLLFGIGFSTFFTVVDLIPMTVTPNHSKCRIRQRTILFI